MSVLAVCQTCGKRKKPLGRDAGLMIDSYCYDYGDMSGDCPGYMKSPRPTTYWAGECPQCDGTGVDFAAYEARQVRTTSTTDSRCQVCLGTGRET